MASSSSSQHNVKLRCCRNCTNGHGSTCENCFCVKRGQRCDSTCVAGCKNQLAPVSNVKVKSPLSQGRRKTGSTSQLGQRHINRITEEMEVDTLDNSDMELDTQTILDALPVQQIQHAVEPRNIPIFPPCSEPLFMWSNVDGAIFARNALEAYEKIVKFRKNLFVLPTGKVSDEFIREHARLFRLTVSGNPHESTAQIAMAIMEHLLLQRPHPKAKTKECNDALKRRWEHWKEGDINELLEEAIAIQNNLEQSRPEMTDEALSKVFNRLMMSGKVTAARQLLTKTARKGGVLPLSNDVMKLLQEKHPPGEPLDDSALVQGELRQVHEATFAGITGAKIRDAAIKTQGGAGPSGGDADHWRHMLTGFRTASTELCDEMAAFARRICSKHMDPISLMPFLSNRLIPLDKCPGLRPIGIGETYRRIIGKAIVAYLKVPILKATGATQLCAGQEAGCEAAIHSMMQLFEADETDALLLVDADNAFNRLNRKAVLHNINFLCPELSIFAVNCYRAPTRLFVAGGVELASREGTTQGDPLAMVLYAIGIMPLIDLLRGKAKQVWFADDAQAADKLLALRAWWDIIVEHGPRYGYFAKPSKTKLIVKPERSDEAKVVFAGTSIEVVAGWRDLGTAIGDTAFIRKYIGEIVVDWTSQVEVLARIANFTPHAAHQNFVAALRNCWSYVQSTTAVLGPLLEPLEAAIRHKLAEALLRHRRVLTNDERALWALPGRLGGMGLDNPEIDSHYKFASSVSRTAPLVKLIIAQERHFTKEVQTEMKKAKVQAKIETNTRLENEAKDLHDRLPAPLQRALLLAQEKGASAIVTTLPLDREGFYMHKSDWCDSIDMRYGYNPPNMPENCPCGRPFSMDHSQNCNLGAFRDMRHNEVRDELAKPLRKIFADVQIEPELQKVPKDIQAYLKQGYRSAIVEDNARSDIRVKGLWVKEKNAFLDVRVFNPNAFSYRGQSINAVYKKHEQEKKRQYNARIREVEHGSFTPLVFASTGGMSKETTVFIKRLASDVAKKDGEDYAHVMGLLRVRLAFKLMRSAITMLRGSRYRRRNIEHDYQRVVPTDVVIAEAHIHL